MSTDLTELCYRREWSGAKRILRFGNRALLRVVKLLPVAEPFRCPEARKS